MQHPVMRWQCRYAPSLGELEGTPAQVWGTKPYLDEFQPTVFFGLYGFRDFQALWNHKGRKAILWAGSDILHFGNGYWLDEEGLIRLDPEALARWINENCESYVENGVEAEALRVHGIESKIVPSFMGEAGMYEVEFTPNNRPQVYLSVSGGNYRSYGWEQIENIADRCEVDFYLYGSDTWKSRHSNVFVKGRVPKDVMNEEIKHMQCGLRLNEFDGFSEILAKSILWGQHPISAIGYPFVDWFSTNEQLIHLLNSLKDKKEPNIKAREYFLSVLNRYPWTYV